MEAVYIYLIAGCVSGFILAWFLRSVTIAGLQKTVKSLSGYLESEKLRKETLLKENNSIHELRINASENHEAEILHLKKMIKRLDEDIILLQKSNEETEALLEAGLPVVHSLKLQLIEANNTIARYKAHYEKNTARV